ncbi:MAG: OprD family outer membrane porin [Verrucomicrobiota bacterium]
MPFRLPFLRSFFRVFLGSAFLAGPALSAAGLPEYLLAEEPLTDELEAKPSPLGLLGAAPEDLSVFPGLAIEEPARPTGEPFFDDTSFFWRPRFYYRHLDQGDGSQSETAALGGALGLQTGYFRNFLRIGLTGFHSHKLYGPEGRDGAGLLGPGQEDYAVLGEAYAELKVSRTSLFSGLNLFNLPYLNANDSRMTPNTFEAYMLRSNEWDHLELGAGHLRRIRFRNSNDYENLARRAGAAQDSPGLSLVGARFALEDRFSIGFIEEIAWDLFHTFYFETTADFSLPEDRRLQLGLQFSDQRDIGQALVGEFSVQHFGAQSSLDLGPLVLSCALSYTSRGPLQKPFGGSPGFTSLMISDFDRPEELALRAGALLNLESLGLKGLTTSLSLGHGTPLGNGTDPLPDQSEFNLTLDYRPPAPGWENVWLRLRYGENERDTRISDFRIIANYSVSF